MISVTCPNCSHGIEAPTGAVGKETKCSHCGHSFVSSTASQVPPLPEAELVLPGRRADSNSLESRQNRGLDRSGILGSRSSRDDRPSNR
jgi:hypothetical protein